ncbi:MAG: hypothetical protein OXF73_00060 [Gammaproteobacteria bacterium]|nr:hypothetical protein [Gammaproteobacteria bacterium]MCY4228060.1 hypothetical protein [Gammaproteobacteria bacterium]
MGLSENYSQRAKIETAEIAWLVPWVKVYSRGVLTTGRGHTDSPVNAAELLSARDGEHLVIPDGP